VTAIEQKKTKKIYANHAQEGIHHGRQPVGQAGGKREGRGGEAGECSKIVAGKMRYRSSGAAAQDQFLVMIL
jgi:hypothetical protein